MDDNSKSGERTHHESDTEEDSCYNNGVRSPAHG